MRHFSHEISMAKIFKVGDRIGYKEWEFHIKEIVSCSIIHSSEYIREQQPSRCSTCRAQYAYRSNRSDMLYCSQVDWVEGLSYSERRARR